MNRAAAKLQGASGTNSGDSWLAAIAGAEAISAANCGRYVETLLRLSPDAIVAKLKTA